MFKRLTLIFLINNNVAILNIIKISMNDSDDSSVLEVTPDYELSKAKLKAKQKSTKKFIKQQLTLSFDVGVKNIGFCCHDESIKTMIECYLISVDPTTNFTLATSVSLALKMLMKNYLLIDVVDVIVERQIMFLGARNYSKACLLNSVVEASIHAFFLASNIRTTSVAPRKKAASEKNSGKSTHYQNKKDSIKLMSDYLDIGGVGIEFSLSVRQFFRDSKKKDDLSDSMIQLMRFKHLIN